MASLCSWPYGTQRKCTVTLSFIPLLTAGCHAPHSPPHSGQEEYEVSGLLSDAPSRCRDGLKVRCP